MIPSKPTILSASTLSSDQISKPDKAAPKSAHSADNMHAQGPDRPSVLKSQDHDIKRLVIEIVARLVGICEILSNRNVADCTTRAFGSVSV